MRQWRVWEKSKYRRQQEAAAQHEDETQRQDHIIRTIVTVRSSIDSMTAEHAANREQAKTLEKAKRKRDWATVGALVAAAVAAIITLGVSHCDNRAIIRESARVAARQHNDTLESNKISREAFTAVQRAYIIITGLRRTVDTYPGWISYQYTPSVINVGSTQTRDFSAMELGPQSMRLVYLRHHLSPAQLRAFCIADKFNLPPDPDIIFGSDTLLRDADAKKFRQCYT